MNTLQRHTINIPFTKMHGLGNDFVMIEPKNLPKDLPEGLDLAGRLALTKILCDRHTGIGGDGMIVIDKPKSPPKDRQTADFCFSYYNSDGTVAEMCGNGIRCFANYIHDHGICDKPVLRIETGAGLLTTERHSDGTVTVDMGKPVLEGKDIPFTGGDTLNINGQDIPITAVSMGNPHAVIFDNTLDPAVFGPLIEVHTHFPQKTNVEFVTIKNRGHVEVVVWERGCGFTQACGTGACAVAVAGVLNDKTNPHVTVTLPGGDLQVDWKQQDGSHVFMTGPAVEVFSGVITVFL